MSGSDSVNVRFGAEIGALTSAIEQLKSHLEGMSGPIGALASQFSELGEAMMAAFAFNQIKAAFESLMEPFEKVAQWAESMGELGEKAEVASQMLGVSTEVLTEWQFAASMAGVSGESMEMGMLRLSRAMANASSPTSRQAAAFRALGISATDSQGQLKQIDTIIPQIADKFAEAANGPAKTALAMELFGRAGARMIPILNKGSEGLDELKQAAKDAGVVMDENRAGAFEQTAQAFKTLSAATTGLSEQIFSYFEPAILSIVRGLTDLIESMTHASSTSSVLHDLWTALVLTVDVLIAGVAGLSAGIQQLWQIFAGFVESTLVSLKILGTALYDLFTGQFGKAKDDLTNGLTELEEIIKDRAHKFATVGEEYGKTIKNLFSNIGAGGVGPMPAPEGEKGKGGTGQLKFDPHAGQQKESRLAAWRDELNQKLIIEEHYLGDTKAEELAYWEAIKARGDLSVKESDGVNQQIFNLRKGMAEQSLRIEEGRIKTQETLGLQQLQDEKDNIQKSIEAQGFGNDKKYQQLGDVTRRMYDLQHESLNQELALPGLDPVKVAELQNKILVLQGKFNSDMNKLNLSAAQDMAKSWEQAVAPIEHAFDGMIDNLINGQMTLQQAVGRMLIQIGEDYIKMAVKAATHWAASEVTKTAATTAGNATRTASDLSADAMANASILARIVRWIALQLGLTGADEASNATRTATTVTSNAVALTDTITTNIAAAESYAAVGAAAAGASVAAIPGIGWAMADEVAAETYAVLASFGAGASAEGGWDRVPEDGMMTQLHKDEMVLPAFLANPLRDALSNAGTSSNVSDNSNNANVSLHYAPQFHGSGSGLERQARSTAEDFKSYLMNVTRNGNLKLPGR